MNRRAFLAISAAGTLGLLRDPRDAAAQSPSAPAVPYRPSRLGISDDDRDGTLYIPKSYKPGVPVPVMMMLHGFAGSGDGVRGMFPLAEEFGVVMIAPESRGLTWGRSIPGFDADVRYLGPAYRHVANIVDIDDTRIALARVRSAPVSLRWMGLAYRRQLQPLITLLMAGQVTSVSAPGKLEIFHRHRVDTQMPIDDDHATYRG